MLPTHQHADGGLYNLMATDIEGKDDLTGDWVPGVLYQDVVTAKKYWTSLTRWADRFEPVQANTVQGTFELIQEEEVVAAFVFKVTSVKDLRHMLTTAGPQRTTAFRPDEIDNIKRILKAQAEMIAIGLHERELDDYPDLIGDVNKFHAKFGQEYLGKPRILPDDLFDFRVKFHEEETHEYRDEQETLKGAIIRQDRRDIINSLELQLDALCDAAWVILGTADLQFGRRAFIEAWRRVVKANMAKVLATDDPNAQDSGREIKYDIRKPAGWQAPDHRDLVSDNDVLDVLFHTPPEDIETNTMNQDAEPPTSPIQT